MRDAHTHNDPCLMFRVLLAWTSSWTNCWWFETPWRLCDVIIMSLPTDDKAHSLVSKTQVNIDLFMWKKVYEHVALFFAIYFEHITFLWALYFSNPSRQSWYSSLPWSLKLLIIYICHGQNKPCHSQILYVTNSGQNRHYIAVQFYVCKRKKKLKENNKTVQFLLNTPMAHHLEQ